MVRTKKAHYAVHRGGKMNCHPGVQGKTIDADTCYTAPVLKKLQRSYNRTYKKSPVRAGTSKKILRELKDRMRDRCPQEEDCLLTLLPKEQQTSTDQSLFAPDQPREWKKNPREWLSNFDLIRVLEQYEEAHPTFHFIGPTPIDFDTRIPDSKTGVCVWEELCTFDLARYLDRGYRKLGIIFNLDKHDQGGSHWVSLFVDLDAHVDATQDAVGRDITELGEPKVRKSSIFYFDSVGNPAPAEIRALMDRIVHQGKAKHLRFRVYENTPMQHQFGDTECGMYSLYFLVTMLTDRAGGTALRSAQGTDGGPPLSMKQKLNLFRKHRISDDEVAAFRHRFFN